MHFVSVCVRHGRRAQLERLISEHHLKCCLRLHFMRHYVSRPCSECVKFYMLYEARQKRNNCLYIRNAYIIIIMGHWAMPTLPKAHNLSDIGRTTERKKNKFVRRKSKNWSRAVLDARTSHTMTHLGLQHVESRAGARGIVDMFFVPRYLLVYRISFMHKCRYAHMWTMTMWAYMRRRRKVEDWNVVYQSAIHNVCCIL